jgi:hypothetical protein
MKKTYIAPGMVIVKVQTAASILTGSSFDLNSERVSGGAALSRERGGNFWDDDEDY